MTSASSPREAAAALHHVDDLQHQTRDTLRSFWFPLVVFGSLTLVSAPVALASGGVAVAVFWAVAGPGGGVAVGWYYRSRELHLGISRSPLPFVTAAAILVFAFFLPAVTTGRLREVVSTFAVAAGYLVFAWFNRSIVLGGLALVIAAIPVTLVLNDTDHAGAIAAAITGVAILATGFVARSAERRRR